MPTVFISYTHDTPEHKDAILALSERLRQEGIDCLIDQYEQSPERGWPAWCERHVAEATFVLVACTETYLSRYGGDEVPNQGLGGTWEGHIITQELYNAQGKNTKFIPITLSPDAGAFIPLTLQSATHYRLDRDYELLYRRLTSQPAIIKSPLGSIVPKAPRLPAQPVLERKQDFTPIWHVRHRRSPFFTGREQLLTDLRKTLETRDTAALTGFGGFGKTQTALEYAYQYRSHYTAVFWIDADLRETLLDGFASVAAVLQLPSAQAKEQEQTVLEVHRWLEDHPGWLLILDNADDLSLVQSFLPTQPNGHLLLTTRAHAVSALAERIPVNVMTPEEGALLLLRRSGAIPKDGLLDTADETNHRAALQLSVDLGGLPLALDQAGAFMEETPLSVAGYAELFHSEKAGLLAERGTLGDHPSVAVTVSLAFGKIAASSPAAGDLIRLCAFLAPDAIPDEIYTACDASMLGEHLGRAANNKLSFAKIIAEACRLSLLERDPANQTLNIHRLVQLVITAAMPETDRRLWAERAVRAVELAFPDPKYVNWPLCHRLVAHAQTCSGLIEAWDFDFLEAAKLLNWAAGYLDQRALFTEAEPLYRRSLALVEKTHGPDDPNVATSLNNLAELYRTQGKYADAELLYRRSLAIREKVTKPDNSDVAISLNNLALLYSNQGKYKEAEPLYLRSLAIWEIALGPDHPHVATSLDNLASLYDDQGKYSEAEPLYRRSLAIRKKAFGPNHPDIAASLNNLAEFYRSQGKYAEAEPLYRHSLTISEITLGPDHPHVATCLNNLGDFHRSQGTYAEAEKLHLRSLDIRTKALGADHPDVAQSLNNLAVLYYNQGKYAEAEPLLRRSLVIREKTLGPAHLYVADSLNNLAELCRIQGEHTKAEQMHQRALAIWESSSNTP